MHGKLNVIYLSIVFRVIFIPLLQHLKKITKTNIRISTRRLEISLSSD
jgi:hypothetical protein